MIDLTISSNAVMYILLVGFIIIISSIIIYKIILEKKEKLKNRKNLATKKDFGTHSPSQINEKSRQIIESLDRKSVYTVYKKSELLDDVDSAELKSRTLENKNFIKYRRYYGPQLMDPRKSDDLSNNIWR